MEYRRRSALYGAISPRDLNRPQRRAIGYLASLPEGEPLLNMPFVGKQSIDELIDLGLIEVAPRISAGEPCYRLTKAGNHMHEELVRLKLIPR
jgi:hypothetical protein